MLTTETLTLPAGYEWSVTVAVGLPSNGNIILAGIIEDTDLRKEAAILLSFNSSGVLDTSFGSAGMVTYEATADSIILHGMEVQGEGILVALSTQTDAFLQAYSQGGVPGITYDSVQQTLIGIHKMPDGSVYAAGGRSGRSGPGTNATIVHYGSDGHLVSNFGANGVLLKPMLAATRAR